MSYKKFIDSQRAKLYKAEREAFRDGPYDVKLDIASAEELIEKLWAQSGEIIKAPSLRTTKKKRQGAAHYMALFHQITFNPKDIRKWVVVHEVAHAVENRGAAHGPEFAAAYLRLVEYAFGFDARERLGASFRAHKVRSHGKSKERKPYTGPKRETKFDKASKLAASLGFVLVKDDWNRGWYDLENGASDKVVDSFYTIDSVMSGLEKLAKDQIPLKF